MNDYENAIEIKGVTKKYDGFTLDNISFDVPKGCIMGKMALERPPLSAVCCILRTSIAARYACSVLTI